jgi:hypothetical protein
LNDRLKNTKWEHNAKSKTNSAPKSEENKGKEKQMQI